MTSMRATALLAALLSVATPAAGQAADTLTVLDYIPLGDSLAVYSAEGKKISQRPVADLPKPPTPVLDTAFDGKLVQVGQDVWLRSNAVELNQKATVTADPTCRLAGGFGKRSDHQANVTRGLGDGC